MDYKEYKTVRNELLKESQLVDQGNIDLYAKYPYTPNFLTGHINNQVYRCHLAEDFIRAYKLENIIPKQELLLSYGVRNSLQLLIQTYKHSHWLIPEDCYPFYTKTVTENNLRTSTYTVLTENNIYSTAIESKAEILLTTVPLKPTGRDLTKEEWTTLKEWVDEPDRILIIDAVYNHQLNHLNELWELYNNNSNVIICYSLSKAYATPTSIGFTATKLTELIPKFRAIPKEQQRLEAGYMLLNHGQRRKHQIQQDLKEISVSLQKLTNMPLSENTYMFHDPDATWVQELAKHNLTIPTSIYESTQPGIIRSGL